MASQGKASSGSVVDPLRQVLDEQVEFYSKRATVYDDAFLRRGRFDRGQRQNRAWLGELAQVERRLESLAPLGAVLELACGTGLWTQRLVPLASSVLAVDASSEMLRACHARVSDGVVRLEQVDLFEWEPEARYDFVFFGFWISHVPRELVAAHWRNVVQSLKPGGRFMFVDHRPSDVTFPGGEEFENDRACRQLADGSSYEVVKVFYSAEEIRRQLAIYSWRTLEISTTSRFFLYGVGQLAAD
jgi:SAM-dependent methyltransferase